jgi:hypothetical protein
MEASRSADEFSFSDVGEQLRQQGLDEVPPALSSTALSPRHQLEAWLAAMVREGASDLILRANGRPSMRRDSKITFLPGRVPAAGPMIEILSGILGKERLEQWRSSGSADAALDFDGLGRFRLNAYRQMGSPQSCCAASTNRRRVSMRSSCRPRRSRSSRSGSVA